VLEQQYYLARKAKISVTDSNSLPVFEVDMFVGLLLKDLKKEQEAMKT